MIATNELTELKCHKIKTRTELTKSLVAAQQQVEETILHDALVLKWFEGKQPKRLFM